MVIAVVFGVLIARQVTIYGGRGFLLVSGALVAVIAVAFIAA